MKKAVFLVDGMKIEYFDELFKSIHNNNNRGNIVNSDSFLLILEKISI